jgi:hypothetical protein
MTLGFMQFFDKKKKEPTNFREKILAGVGEPPTRHGWTPKLHTIREDKHNRWKAGMSIQMVYRGPKYSILDHFNKGIPELEKCVSVQKIDIKWESFIGLQKPALNIQIDNGRSLTTSEITQLAINDGFKDIEQFCRWFNKDFSGNLIHWTDLKY